MKEKTTSPIATLSPSEYNKACPHQLCHRIEESLARRLAEMNLDNGTARSFDLMARGDTAMKKVHRQRVIVGYDAVGVPIYRQLQAQSEQEMNDRIVQLYVETGRINQWLPAAPIKPQTETNFREYAEKWMKVYKEPMLKPKTYASYRGCLVSHLYPEFGERDIEDIESGDVMAFLSSRRSMAKKSLKLYLDLLRQILDSAVEDGIITKNPARDKRVQNPSTKVTKRVALTETEFKEIMQGLYGMRHTYLTTLAGAGADVKTLQAVAGYADSQMTMNTYIHPKVENLQRAGEMMDSILHGYATDHAG